MGQNPTGNPAVPVWRTVNGDHVGHVGEAEPAEACLGLELGSGLGHQHDRRGWSPIRKPSPTRGLRCRGCTPGQVQAGTPESVNTVSGPPSGCSTWTWPAATWPPWTACPPDAGHVPRRAAFLGDGLPVRRTAERARVRPCPGRCRRRRRPVRRQRRAAGLRHPGLGRAGRASTTTIIPFPSTAIPASLRAGAQPDSFRGRVRRRPSKRAVDDATPPGLRLRGRGCT
jgi:hypothetical protein